MDKLSLDNFDWGWMNQPMEVEPNRFVYHIYSDGTKKHMSHYHRDSIIEEIFNEKVYEKFFEVSNNQHI